MEEVLPCQEPYIPRLGKVVLSCSYVYISYRCFKTWNPADWLQISARK